MLQSSYGQVDDYFDIEDTGPTVGPYKRPILLTIFAPLFLKSPDVYAVELHSFHENFTLERWRSFVHKVDTSIRDSNLLACRILCFRSAIPHATICCVKATVLLSTNVGLLSWGDGGRKGGINSPTAVQIVTYISIICTVGSIIIGLAIFKQYRAKRADTPLRAVTIDWYRHATRLTSFTGRSTETYPERALRSRKALHHMQSSIRVIDVGVR